MRQKLSRIAYVALTFIMLSLALPSTTWAVEYKALYKFQGGADGYYPDSVLIFDAAGNLYGTTFYGGTYNYGTVFTLTPNPDGSWTKTVLHSFSGHPTDGASPYAALIFDAVGNLYGTTYAGGAHNRGTAFRLRPRPGGTLSETIIYSFAWVNGRFPTAGLIFDAAGSLYGTTGHGGAYDDGRAFKLTPNPDGSWSKRKLHAFKGPDGAYPLAELVLDAVGNLYGTTVGGGTYEQGTAFKLIPNPDGSWTRRKLHIFKGPDGMWPYAGLIFDAAGNLYGTTERGGGTGCWGGTGCGVVFRITP